MGEIIVIGGGAAGMMAAAAASAQGHHVILTEKNEKLGKKLFITGKGRCNVTNAADMETLFANVCTNPKFLYSAFYGFDNHQVMRMFEAAGCPLKTERGNRVFPASDHSSDVIAALVRILKKQGVDLRLNACVEEILLTAADCPSVRGVRLQSGEIVNGEAVIVCTGGLSYPSTGSTGDGFRFARHTGHKVTECRPSLTPLETEEGWCRELMGLSLRNVGLRMVSGGKELYRGQGELLFTHFGVSGPLALTASCYLGKAGGGKASRVREREVKLYLDLKPALSMEQLDRRLLRDFEEQRNRQFKNALGGLFPGKLIPVMVELSGIDGIGKVCEITKAERRAFAELIKNLPLTVSGTRSYPEAVITQGGVSVKDINPSTMGSRIVPGLYFAGEVLDVDARTGGFNLQIAWSTGHLAGESAAEQVGGTTRR